MPHVILNVCVGCFRFSQAYDDLTDSSFKGEATLEDRNRIIGYFVMTSIYNDEGKTLFPVRDEQVRFFISYNEYKRCVSRLLEVYGKPCPDRYADNDGSFTCGEYGRPFNLQMAVKSDVGVRVLVRLYLNILAKVGRQEQFINDFNEKFFTRFDQLGRVSAEGPFYRLKGDAFKNIYGDAFREADIRFSPHKFLITPPASPLQALSDLVLEGTPVLCFRVEPQNLIDLLIAAAARFDPKAICHENRKQRVNLLYWLQRTILRNLRFLYKHERYLKFSGVVSVFAGSKLSLLDTFLSKFFISVHMHDEVDSFQKFCSLGVDMASTHKEAGFGECVLEDEMKECSSVDDKAYLRRKYITYVNQGEGIVDASGVPGSLAFKSTRPEKDSGAGAGAGADPR